MISAVVSLTVYGDSYDELLENAKDVISELFELEDRDDIESKFNIQLNIQELIESVDFSKEKSYKADVTVKVINV